jgi:hypothetical protein
VNFVWATINNAGLWNIFIEELLLLMSLTFAILGILTAYFGSGKSRIAGASLLVVGIIIPLVLYFVEWMHNPGYFMNNLFLPGLIYIGAALIGVIIGFLVFLGIIMKT